MKQKHECAVHSHLNDLIPLAAVFHVEVGSNAAVQHHGAKALHLQGAQQHGGHQPRAGEGLHQRQRREGGAEGGSLNPSAHTQRF